MVVPFRRFFSSLERGIFLQHTQSGKDHSKFEDGMGLGGLPTTTNEKRRKGTFSPSSKSLGQTPGHPADLGAARGGVDSLCGHRLA